LWPESLIASTDAALAAFEAELAALLSVSEHAVDDNDVLAVVRRAVLALNAINDQHVRTSRTGYETGEREDLCGYVRALFAAFPSRSPLLPARSCSHRAASVFPASIPQRERG